MVRIIARTLWGIPALLLLLAFNQAQVAYHLHTTWRQGTQATAEVLEWQRSNRADVTYGYVSLRVPLDGGHLLQKDKMSLPYALLPRLEGKRTVNVHVRPGATQEVVIDAIMPAHWLIALSQVGISLVGAVLFFVGVYYWNAQLRSSVGAYRTMGPANVRGASG